MAHLQKHPKVILPSFNYLHLMFMFLNYPPNLSSMVKSRLKNKKVNNKDFPYHLIKTKWIPNE